MLDRVEIMKGAWREYRIRRTGIYLPNGNKAFVRSLFAKCLRWSWENFRRAATRRPEALTASVVASAVNLSAAMKAARIAEIDAELTAQDYSDCPTNWGRRLSLRAERAELAA